MTGMYVVFMRERGGVFSYVDAGLERLLFVIAIARGVCQRVCILTQTHIFISLPMGSIVCGGVCWRSQTYM